MVEKPASRKRGTKPKFTPEQRARAVELMADTTLSIEHIVNETGMSASTLYRFTENSRGAQRDLGVER